MRYTFTYQANAPTTVKRLLAKAGVSHRLFARAVATHAVQKNDRVTANAPLQPGDTVTFVVPSDKPVPPSAGPLRVVQETANWLVVDKPAGLASVPGPSAPTASLLNRAAAYLQAAGVTAPQPGVITRLDRDTVGLVLIAKHPFAQSRLDQVGVDHAITKTYRAVVSGTLTPARGTITAPLAKAADGIHREVRANGQAARTDYVVEATGNGLSLVRLHLFTGRTHQIRVHLASLGHPLVGDALYGGDLRLSPTQLLQAAVLTLQDPFTGTTLTARLPLPAAWAALLHEKNR